MKTLSLNEFHKVSQNLEEGDILLDVRNPEEFEAARIKGAINIPVGDIPNRSDELKNYKHIYIYCKRGGRAQIAYQALSSLGYSNITCLAEAGMDAWLENRFETEN
ncbi:MAG TPA: rhodanese-like domain-containing protein [Bacteriovoracaceae bacterium]|nr:rhodanese-like domain-containing protein [Bacteriovoracaceae bacterium]